MKRILQFVAFGALLAGCVGIPRDLETPDISFVSMRALEANLFEQRLEVRMRVKNPNSIELPVKGLDIDVELADEPFAHGISAREFTVPARGEAEFDMIVTANAATALLKILGAGGKSHEEVGYRMKGKLSTRLGMLRTIPFDETGTLPLGELTGKRRKKG